MSHWKEFLDTLHAECASLVEHGRSLESLGDAFYVTGNTIVAGQLQSMGEELRRIGNDLPRAYGRKLSEDVNGSQRAVAETFKAMLSTVPGTSEG